MAGIITEGLGEDPLAGGGATGFVLTTLTPDASRLYLSFSPSNLPSALTGPATMPGEWKVTPTNGGSAVTVTGVAIVSSQVVLTTTPQSAGALYRLDIPLGMMSFGFGFLGSYSATFAGVATVPGITIIRAVDARTIDVVFSDAPSVLADALNPAKYSIDGGLKVTAVQQLSSMWFRLTTTHQTLGTTYTVTYPV